MPPWSRLTPWIESLILSYGSREEAGSGSSCHLKAHVIGVGQMTQSQARGTDGPTGLLFLSDGVLQIPAVLTASAWEHLQENEDRECFSSLLNATVLLQDYRLQFHMDPLQTKCRFFLSVGQLATTAAGPVKDNTPCCTSLASIRMKICRTWRSLLGQEDSQQSQGGLDLSELLGEWQHDCMQTLLQNVRDRLMTLRSARPSTSAQSPSPGRSYATGWDLDRVRYKGEPSFSIPVKFLLIPEEDAQQLEADVEEAELQIPNHAGGQMVQDAGNTSGQMVQDAGNTSGQMVQDAGNTGGQMVQDAGNTSGQMVQHAGNASGQMVQDAGNTGGQIGPDVGTTAGQMVQDAGDSSPTMMEDLALLSVLNVELPSNPWDLFPPLGVTFSSSESSPESTPTLPPTEAIASVAVATSTQLPVHSFLPPYQKPPSSSLPTMSSSSSTTISPREPPATGGTNPLQKRPVDTAQGTYRKPKRKRCEVAPEETVVEEEVSGSPPSWLFDSLVEAYRKEAEGSPKQPGTGTILKKPLSVHSNGRPFTYSYRVLGQNLQDLSRFGVASTLLHWAVRYLLTPKPAENLQSID